MISLWSILFFDINILTGLSVATGSTKGSCVPGRVQLSCKFTFFWWWTAVLFVVVCSAASHRLDLFYSWADIDFRAPWRFALASLWHGDKMILWKYASFLVVIEILACHYLLLFYVDFTFSFFFHYSKFIVCYLLLF